MINISDDEQYTESTFTALNASRATIKKTKFYECTFNSCNFSEVKFIDCKFYNCEFINCNLSMLSINGCSFREVIFNGCKMVGIDWTRGAWPNVKLNSPISFEQCILNNSLFCGLSLSELKMEECKAHDVDFSTADLKGASFIFSDLSSSTFHQTNLMGADFTDATNYRIDIFNNYIKKAKFNLPEAVSLLAGLDIEIVD